jgi:AraC-like DNA-binding protein
MVCSRCKMAVKTALEKAGLYPLTIDLGEIELEKSPTPAQLEDLGVSLGSLGFELIDDKKSRVIGQIKTLIIKWVHHSGEPLAENLSGYLAARLHYEYTYLSSLFSEVEGTTIEKFFIAQKIERAKELLVYNELSLSEIADKLGYSSVAHLSSQFKKTTGLTPSYYKSLKDHKRKNIEDL